LKCDEQPTVHTLKSLFRRKTMDEAAGVGAVAGLPLMRKKLTMLKIFVIPASTNSSCKAD